MIRIRRKISLSDAEDCLILYDFLRNGWKSKLENLFYGFTIMKKLKMLAHLKFIGMIPDIKERLYFSDLRELINSFTEHLVEFTGSKREDIEKLVKLLMDELGFVDSFSAINRVFGKFL